MIYGMSVMSSWNNDFHELSCVGELGGRFYGCPVMFEDKARLAIHLATQALPVRIAVRTRPTRRYGCAANNERVRIDVIDALWGLVRFSGLVAWDGDVLVEAVRVAHSSVLNGVSEHWGVLLIDELLYSSKSFFFLKQHQHMDVERWTGLGVRLLSKDESLSAEDTGEELG